MLAFLTVLLVVWLVLVVVGLAIKALLWLALVGLALFAVTGAGVLVRYLGNDKT